MIVRVAPRGSDASEALAEALGRPVSVQEGLTEHTVVAHWPGQVRYVATDRPDGASLWTSDEWAEHLDDMCWKWPASTDRHGSRDAIWNAVVRLHPGDRLLTRPEWSEVAHRLARTAHIAVPGDERGCRWFAVQAQPGRLDLLASLIREDGAWQKQPHTLLRRLADEARRIESDLGLIPVPNAPTHWLPAAAARTAPSSPVVPSAAMQFSALLAQLSHETDGPLAAVRGVVEHTAHRLAMWQGALGHSGVQQRLEWIARRLYAIQHDLDTTAADLAAPPRRTTPPPTAPVPQPPTGSVCPRTTP